MENIGYEITRMLVRFEGDIIDEALRLHRSGAVEPSCYSNQHAYLNLLLIQALRNIAARMQPDQTTEFGKVVAKELANLAKF